MIYVTENAKKKIRELRNRDGGKYLRLYTKGMG
jgi:hypothetical protein